MGKFTSLLIIIVLISSSCASILNPKYQKITISKESSDEILINEKPAVIENDKYLVERDRKPKQITLKSEGFKDENVVIMPFKKSPLYILSCFPFGVLYFPPLVDHGPKAWNYSREEISFKKIAEIEIKPEDAKEIKVNKVSVALKKENINYNYFPTYKYYLRNSKREALNKKNEKVKPWINRMRDNYENVNIENSIFSNGLNEYLRDKGYIDTTKKAIKDNYLENLLIDAEIVDYTVNHISNRYYYGGGMFYVDLSINWEILDFYKNPIYSETTNSRSTEFAYSDFEEIEEALNNSVKDVMKTSFIELMKSKKVISWLFDKSESEKEKKMENLNIPQSNSYASDLSQVLNSTLTLKSKKGFGSGFLISSDGYIITNYHVIADSSEFKAILQDRSEHDVEIIRVSKIHDLALLKINVKELTPLRINLSKDFKIASSVYAVGTPSAEDLSQTISKGIISGIRNSGSTKLIQTDASINSGNSGGPIVSDKGEVLGVVTSKLRGFGVEGVAFGIPAYEILKRLKIIIR